MYRVGCVRDRVLHISTDNQSSTQLWMRVSERQCTQSTSHFWDEQMNLCNCGFYSEEVFIVAATFGPETRREIVQQSKEIPCTDRHLKHLTFLCALATVVAIHRLWWDHKSQWFDCFVYINFLHFFVWLLTNSFSNSKRHIFVFHSATAGNILLSQPAECKWRLYNLLFSHAFHRNRRRIYEPWMNWWIEVEISVFSPVKASQWNMPKFPQN